MKFVYLLVALGLVSVFLSAPPASAGVATHRDPAHDVFAGRDNGQGAPMLPAPAPNMARADIIKIRVDHEARVVRVTFTMRHLARVGGTTWFSASIRTPKGEWVAAFQTGPSLWAGSKALFLDGRGIRRTCAGIGHTVNYRTNTASLSVPTGCLKRPAFVRVDAFVDLTEHGWTYSDDAYSTGPNQGTVYGPKVYL